MPLFDQHDIRWFTFFIFFYPPAPHEWYVEPHLKRLSLQLFSSTLSFSGLDHPIQFTGTDVHLLATHVTDWPICVTSKCRVQLCMCRRVILWLDKTQEFFQIPEVPDRKKSESVSGMRNKQLHSVWWAFASGGGSALGEMILSTKLWEWAQMDRDKRAHTSIFRAVAS